MITARSRNKGSEISELTTLAAELDRHGGDPGRSAQRPGQRRHLMTDEHADYLVTINASLPPGCWPRPSERYPGQRPFEDHTTHDRGHGCTELARVQRSPERTLAQTTAHLSRSLSGQLLIATAWRRHLRHVHHRDHVEYRPASAVESPSNIARGPCLDDCQLRKRAGQ